MKVRKVEIYVIIQRRFFVIYTSHLILLNCLIQERLVGIFGTHEEVSNI